MIKREYYDTRKDGVNLYKTYSTDNLYIRKIGTNEIYDVAIDVENAPYEYEEMENKIEEDEESEVSENVRRKYIALVHGIIKKDGVIKSYLKETKTLLTYSTNDKSGKYSETIYKRLEYNKQYSLVEIEIKTGRKNQIRVHMADNKTPILGDRKYGKKDGYRKMMLLANELEFNHPVTKEHINIKLDIPNEYKKVVENE